MKQIVLASGNPGKLAELTALLKHLPIEIIPQQQFGVGDADETGQTFIENAILKARHASQATGLPAIADDSGLVVDALNGAPGIYSARYSGNGPAANIEKLLLELQNVSPPQRTARFYCTIVFMKNAVDPTPIIAEANWEGSILSAATGKQGFGYDPIFFVSTHNCSAAELKPEEKNGISHRGQALEQLIEKLADYI